MNKLDSTMLKYNQILEHNFYIQHISSLEFSISIVWLNFASFNWDLELKTSWDDDVSWDRVF